MAKALRDQLVILRNALDNIDRSQAFGKTIAGVLRILIYTKGRNKPLLFSLADSKGEQLIVTTDGPPHLQRTLSLRDFFQGSHFSSGTENIEMTIEEFIGYMSQEDGGAHEDPELTRDYLFSKAEGLLVAGLPLNIYALLGYARTVYFKAKEFLDKYFPELAETPEEGQEP